LGGAVAFFSAGRAICPDNNKKADWEDAVSVGTDATTLLRRWTDGDSDAINEVVTLLYEQMHRIAAGELRHERHLTIQPTQLVNDVYLRLVDLRKIDWQDRSHFLAMFARIARRAWWTKRASVVPANVAGSPSLCQHSYPCPPPACWMSCKSMKCSPASLPSTSSHHRWSNCECFQASASKKLRHT
jgi:hypothetical protein